MNMVLAVITTTIGFFLAHSGLHQGSKGVHHHQHNHHHRQNHHYHWLLLHPFWPACMQERSKGVQICCPHVISHIAQIAQMILSKKRAQKITHNFFYQVITCGRKLLLSQCWSLQMYWQWKFLFIFRDYLFNMLIGFPFFFTLVIWMRSYLPSATKMSIMKKITENTFRRNHATRYSISLKELWGRFFRLLGDSGYLSSVGA